MDEYNRDTQPLDRSAGLEMPAGVEPSAPQWSSDIFADMLRRLGVPFVALVPGSSYRGLQDSLVNYLGNRDPQIVLCLHEEHAVAIAEGYARVTRSPMAVALHANIGLMHAAMPIYNAWCDRMPMLILGATGPVDAHQRRPWIDWVHTSSDQGALVRSYVKWDDQPASAEAAVESLLRAHRTACAKPQGPTYVCLDAALQEEKLSRSVAIPDIDRFAPAMAPAAPRQAVDDLARAIHAARRPLFLFGRGSRLHADWDNRVRLAEICGAAVMTSMHNAAAFPTDHAQHFLPPCGEKRSEAEKDAVLQADLIVSFDWMDLAGFLRSCTGSSQTQDPIATTIVSCSLDEMLANGWSKDHQALAACDVPLLADPDGVCADLLECLQSGAAAATDWNFSAPHWSAKFNSVPPGGGSDRIPLGDFAASVRRFGMANPVTFVRLPLGWPPAASHFGDPLAYLGKDIGGAVGVGPGHAVGAALALAGSGRIVTAVLGDGDTLMGINALWTASHMKLAMLIVVANNSSYFNDELHQERVALARERPVENRWIGQRLSDPEIDIPAMARAQGFEAFGPVRDANELDDVLARAAEAVSAGGRVLVDARIEEGYAA